MTGLPGDVLAALSNEETMLANPGADVFGDYNRPVEPTDPAEFAAMIEQTMRDMWSCHPFGAPQFSWWRRPPRRLNLFPLRGEPARRRERSAWQEAGRSAWIEGVRERLQSAAYAASNGYSFTWTGPGVFGVPGLPEGLQVQHAGQPWRPGGSEETVHDA